MFEYHLVLFQTLLGIIDANENDNDGINKILHDFQQYQASAKDGEGQEILSPQSYAGDQLSVERAVNAQFQVSNGYTPTERFENMNLK
jgi:hypothetical protein